MAVAVGGSQPFPGTSLSACGTIPDPSDVLQAFLAGAKKCSRLGCERHTHACMHACADIAIMSAYGVCAYLTDMNAP